MYREHKNRISQSGRKITEFILSIWVHVLLVLAAGLFIFPFYWMISSSFKDIALIMRFPPVLFPKIDQLTLNGYIQTFATVPFARYLLNSALVTGCWIVGGITINCLAGYALARLRFPGRDMIFFILLSTLFIPFQVVMVPAFHLVNAFGWVDSYQALIVPWLPNAMAIFFLRQFFLTIPREYDEAAILEGASRFQVFYKIILPMAKPAVATVAILTFVWSWDSYLWPLIVIRSQEKCVVQLGLATFFGQYVHAWNMIMAGATMGAIPSFIIFLSLQKYYIGGIALTGLKQ